MESRFQQQSNHFLTNVCYVVPCASVYIIGVMPDRVSALPGLCPSLVAMATRQQVETAMCKGVRGNMKCIYDLLCRRVFVRESKNCIRLVTTWEGVCVFVPLHTRGLLSIVQEGFLSTGAHTHKKTKTS